MAAKRKPKRPRRKKGLLISMRDVPSRPPRRDRSLGRKIVEWTLGVLAAAVILIGVGLLGVRFFFPNLGAEIRETTVTIDTIVPAGDAPTGVDTPIVMIEKAETWLRIPPAVPAEFEEGTSVRVTYEWIPTTGTVRVQAWEVVQPSSNSSNESSETRVLDPGS